MRQLRAADGGQVLVFGSRTGWNDLLTAGLVDELHLLVGPTLLGDGVPVFAVADLAPAGDFYARVFDRRADIEPMPSLQQRNHEPAGGLQVVEDAEHSGSSMCTLLVADLDATIAELGARGIETGAPTGTNARIAQLTDPAGNTVTLAEIGSVSRPRGSSACRCRWRTRTRRSRVPFSND